MNQGARPSTGSLFIVLGTIITAAVVAGAVAAGSAELFLVAAAFVVLTGGGAIVGAIVRHMRSGLQQQGLPPARAPKQLPRAARRQRMPSPQSAASEPMQGLAGAEAALANLLGQLRNDNADPSWIAYAWQVANNAAAEFRTVADKLESVEWAMAHTPVSQRPTLHDGLVRLRKWLDDGLEAYRGMVAAASTLVLASAPASAVNELTEAADHLASVAQALTELSAQYSWIQAR